MKPTRYVVEYWDTSLVEQERARCGDDFDPADVTVRKNYASIADAKRFLAERAALREGPMLYERKNFRDVTPEGDPRGLLWEYDTELLEAP